jgi:glycosyltransferase involved in cell wall biosynthesis
MDIALFCPKLTTKGGAEIYLTKVSEMLAKRHDITIYTMAYSKQVFPEVKDLVTNLGMPWLMKRTEGKKASMIVTINAVKSINKKIPKGHELYNMHIFPSNFISNRKPMVWTAQEPSRMLYDLKDQVINELNSFQKIVAKAYFPLLRKWDVYETNKNVDRIIVNSNYSKSYIQSVYNKPVQVIYPGVHENFFKVIKKESNTLLSVGRLYEAKRIDLVIKSFKKIVEKFPSMTLEIIGKGPMEQSLKLLTKQLNISNKVKFRGELNEQELLDAYSRAKAVLYYPLREMFGMVPLEAMATGTPVIAVNEGGFTEVIKNNAILTRPEPSVIASKTIELLSDKELSRRLSIKGKQIVNKYNWKDVAKQTEREFKKSLY